MLRVESAPLDLAAVALAHPHEIERVVCPPEGRARRKCIPRVPVRVAMPVQAVHVVRRELRCELPVAGPGDRPGDRRVPGAIQGGWRPPPRGGVEVGHRVPGVLQVACPLPGELRDPGGVQGGGRLGPEKLRHPGVEGPGVHLGDVVQG